MCDDVPAPTPGTLKPTANSKRRTTVKVIQKAIINARTSKSPVSIAK